MNLPSDASQDQSNCPPDYYRRSNGMLHQIPANNTTDTQSPLSAEEIARLANDADAVRNLCKERLIEIVANSARTTALTPVIKELLDRIDGKAPQSIAMTVKADPVSTLSSDQLAALLSMLPDPVIIPPMPKKLDIVD